MTCIVAMKHKGTVFMAGDSAMLSGLDIDYAKKIFNVGDFLIGQSGWLRFSQLMEFNLEIPSRENEKSDMAYIVSKLVPAIRQCAKDNGYAKIENSTERVDDMLLVGYRGNIYKIYSDFSVQCSSLDFSAIGCGADYALGALAVLTKSVKLDTDGVVDAILIKALEVSAEFNVGVAGPFYVDAIDADYKPE